MSPATVITELLATTAGIGAVVTLAVDQIRNALGDRGHLPKWLWPAASAAVGIGTSLLFQINTVGSMFPKVPRLTGLTGQVITGLIAAGGGKYGHEIQDWLSSASKARALLPGYAAAAPLTRARRAAKS
jgi:hypothetical protein